MCTKSVVNKFSLFNNFNKVRIKLNNTKNHISKIIICTLVIDITKK